MIAPTHPEQGDSEQASISALSGRSVRGFARIALVMAAGVAIVAVADTGARHSQWWAALAFWIGLAAIFVPAAIRLVGPTASPRERLWLVVTTGAMLYLVKVLRDPLAFSYHDELGHVRSTADILATHHLFTHNPLVGAYPYYPGIEIVTSALARVGELSIFHGGVLVLGLVRVVLGVALFLFYERVGGSARVAGIAALLYMGNPNFLFFDSQFAYETLALPLAVVILYALAGPRLNDRGLQVALAIVVGGLVVTHHMTPLALSVFLLAWVAFHLGGRRREQGDRDWTVVGFAVFTTTAFVLWFVLVAGKETLNELGPSFTGSLDAVRDLVRGTSGAKKVFGAASGPSDPPIVQLLGFASVGMILVGLPVGLKKLWDRHGRDVLALLLTAAAALYPVTLVLRLTQAGSELSNRASEFLFVGIAFVLALAVVDLKLPRRIRQSSPRIRLRATTGMFAALVTLVFLGGVVVGTAPYSRQPGPYLVGADMRSVDPHSVQAAKWAGQNLPPRSRILTDRTNGETMTAYGRVDPVTGNTANGIPVSDLFTSLTFGSVERDIIQSEKVRYLVVDRRLSESAPAVGVYFDRNERGAYSHKTPISPDALAKFNTVLGLSRIYDDGAIAIYDTSGLR